ncbi:MAG TPA: UDP-N-acetylmuramate dehydrogenase [Candidatus Paceibacterota bacterium]
MNDFSLLKQQLPGVRRDIPLKDHTTFRIGGPAKYFFIAKTSNDIAKAVSVARNLKLPFFLLSGGSNVLASDDGFPGLVVKIQNSKFKLPLDSARGKQTTKVWAEAGVSMATLVRETGKRGLAGLEWAGGLPGTVGGAVRGNAGAFGGEIKDTTTQVEAIDEKGKRKTFSRKECKFGYRSSIFKEKNLVVLDSTFQLRKGNKKEIQAVAKDHIRYRKERHPLEYPNAGSIFKNCDLAKVPKELAESMKDVIKMDPFPVIPTAAILARAKLQGLRVGDAQISEKHPNYIVNRGDASAKDVIQLIAKTKKLIKKKFGVELEEEISFPH